jgi:hypothetical protein
MANRPTLCPGRQWYGAVRLAGRAVAFCLQIECLEALREPAIHRGEQVVGLDAIALIAPKPGEAHGCAQLPGFRALRLGNIESLAEAGLGSGSAIRSTVLEQ